MSFGLLLAGFLATTNVGRVALARERSRPRPGSVALALAAGIALVVVAVVFADDVLDALSISPESFRIAAGIVLAVTAVRTLLWPAASAAPFAAVLITPERGCRAPRWGAAAPRGRTGGAGAAARGVGATAAAARLPIPAALTAQLLAALQVVVAVALAISGMRDV